MNPILRKKLDTSKDYRQLLRLIELNQNGDDNCTQCKEPLIIHTIPRAKACNKQLWDKRINRIVELLSRHTNKS